ncbi:MAG: hypothetical protein ACKVTZ_12930 [Bacteroidia bacterium]
MNEVKIKVLASLLETHYTETSGYQALSFTQVLQEIVPNIRILLDNKDLHFIVSAEKVGIETQTATFLSENEQILTERFVNQTASGGSFYTFIQAKITTHPSPFLSFHYSQPEDSSKEDKVNVMLTLPYLLKALLDDCRSRGILGIEIEVMDLRFHVLDNKSYRYYDCMKRLLAKLYV